VRILNSQGGRHHVRFPGGAELDNNVPRAYNLRVVNMSIGTAAIDSFMNDPLCQAVRALPMPHPSS